MVVRNSDRTTDRGSPRAGWHVGTGERRVYGPARRRRARERRTPTRAGPSGTRRPAGGRRPRRISAATGRAPRRRPLSRRPAPARPADRSDRSDRSDHAGSGAGPPPGEPARTAARPAGDGSQQDGPAPAAPPGGPVGPAGRPGRGPWGQPDQTGSGYGQPGRGPAAGPASPADQPAVGTASDRAGPADGPARRGAARRRRATSGDGRLTRRGQWGRPADHGETGPYGQPARAPWAPGDSAYGRLGRQTPAAAPAAAPAPTLGGSPGAGAPPERHDPVVTIDADRDLRRRLHRPAGQPGVHRPLRTDPVRRRARPVRDG